MRILDWNVCSFCRDQPKVIEKALSYDADIMCLQEVTPKSLEILSGVNGYKLSYTNDSRGEGNTGCYLVTLSRKPVLSTGEVEYEGGDIRSPVVRVIKRYKKEAEEHVALYTDIDIGDETIRLYNIHISWAVTPSIRLQQFESFVEQIKGHDLTKVVIGDLNVYGSLTYYNVLVSLFFGYKRSDIRFDERGWFDKKFEELKLQNPFAGTISWPKIPFNAQLDHILLPENWKVKMKKHTRKTYGSDHTPYLLEVDI